MTMPAPDVRRIELPAPQYPMIVLMFTDNLVPEGSGRVGQTISWAVSKAHPFVPEMNVVRMFVDRGGVEVYSASNDGKIGIRDLVPMDRVRLIQEAMPLEVFVEELDAAESGDDDEDEDPEPEPELPEPNPATGP